MQPEYVKINLYGLKCLNSKRDISFFNTQFIVLQYIQIINICSQFCNKAFIYEYISEIK